jgi:hypothetical protein
MEDNENEIHSVLNVQMHKEGEEKQIAMKWQLSINIEF